MDRVTAELTVFFEDPFWIGIYQRLEGGKLTVNRWVFGAEPKDYEVYETYLRLWNQLRFSPPVPDEGSEWRTANPKRRQRLAQRQMRCHGVGTKAQQALKLQQEQGKEVRSACRRERAALEKERKFALRQQKKKERHRGR